jgi:hypothetical protein
MSFWTRNKTSPQPQIQESQVTTLPEQNEEPDESQLPLLPPRSNQNSEYPIIENDEDLEKIEKEIQKTDKEIKNLQQTQQLQKKSSLRFADEIDIDEEEILLKKLEKIREEKERKRLEEEQRQKELEENEYSKSEIGYNENYQIPTYLSEAECLRVILQQSYDLNKKLDYLIVELNKQQK